MSSTFKQFELRVLYVARRLNIPVSEIVNWYYTDLIKAWDLLSDRVV